MRQNRGRRGGVLWDLWEYAFYFLSQNLGNVVYYTVLQRLLLSMRMKNRYANRLSWKNTGGSIVELIKEVIDEIELRKHGKYGALKNLSNIELYVLAYQFKIKLVG